MENINTASNANPAMASEQNNPVAIGDPFNLGPPLPPSEVDDHQELKERLDKLNQKEQSFHKNKAKLGKTSAARKKQVANIEALRQEIVKVRERISAERAALQTATPNQVPVQDSPPAPIPSTGDPVMAEYGYAVGSLGDTAHVDETGNVTSASPDQRPGLYPNLAGHNMEAFESTFTGSNNLEAPVATSESQARIASPDLGSAGPQHEHTHDGSFGGVSIQNHTVGPSAHVGFTAQHVSEQVSFSAQQANFPRQTAEHGHFTEQTSEHSHFTEHPTELGHFSQQSIEHRQFAAHQNDPRGQFAALTSDGHRQFEAQQINQHDQLQRQQNAFYDHSTMSGLQAHSGHVQSVNEGGGVPGANPSHRKHTQRNWSPSLDNWPPTIYDQISQSDPMLRPRTPSGAIGVNQFNTATYSAENMTASFDQPNDEALMAGLNLQSHRPMSAFQYNQQMDPQQMGSGTRMLPAQNTLPPKPYVRKPAATTPMAAGSTIYAFDMTSEGHPSKREIGDVNMASGSKFPISAAPRHPSIPLRHQDLDIKAMNGAGAAFLPAAASLKRTGPAKRPAASKRTKKSNTKGGSTPAQPGIPTFLTTRPVPDSVLGGPVSVGGVVSNKIARASPTPAPSNIDDDDDDDDPSESDNSGPDDAESDEISQRAFDANTGRTKDWLSYSNDRSLDREVYLKVLEGTELRHDPTVANHRFKCTRSTPARLVNRVPFVTLRLKMQVILQARARVAIIEFLDPEVRARAALEPPSYDKKGTLIRPISIKPNWLKKLALAEAEFCPEMATTSPEVSLEFLTNTEGYSACRYHTFDRLEDNKRRVDGEPGSGKREGIKEFHGVAYDETKVGEGSPPPGHLNCGCSISDALLELYLFKTCGARTTHPDPDPLLKGLFMQVGRMPPVERAHYLALFTGLTGLTGLSPELYCGGVSGWTSGPGTWMPANFKYTRSETIIRFHCQSLGFADEHVDAMFAAAKADKARAGRYDAARESTNGTGSAASANNTTSDVSTNNSHGEEVNTDEDAEGDITEDAEMDDSTVTAA